MKLYRIQIKGVNAPFLIPAHYTVIIHFKNPNGTYANDDRLPHGYRQNVFIDRLPFSVDFQFPADNFYISDIITQVSIIGDGVQETGEVQGELNLLTEDTVLVLNIEKECN